MMSSRLHSRYDILSVLGEGVSSTVFLAFDTRQGHCVAVKRIGKHLDSVNIQKVKRELEVLKELDHPFIVRFLESFEDDHYFYIVTENCEGGGLDNLVMRMDCLNEPHALMIFIEVAFAIAYLHHDKKVMHRDLKLENILLDEHGHAKLSDFGFSTVFENDAPMQRTACGSPAYAPPEIVRHAEYTNKADVWSLGVLLYVMLTGTLPFYGENIQQCMTAILECEPSYPETMSKGVKDLLQKMLEKDFEARPSIDDVLAHPVVTQHYLFSQIQRLARATYHLDSAEKVALIGTWSNGFRPDMRKLASMGASKARFSAVTVGVPRELPVIRASESMRTGYTPTIPTSGTARKNGAQEVKRAMLKLRTNPEARRFSVIKTRTTPRIATPWLSA